MLQFVLVVEEPNPSPAPNASAYDGSPSFIQISGVNYAVAGGGSGGSPVYTSTSPDVGNVLEVHGLVQTLMVVVMVVLDLTPIPEH